ncbi:MAG: hypothetical protein ABEJ57_05275 [Halobacteriaceae archaeon]
MDRRTLLRAAGLGVIAGAPGCTSFLTSEDTAPVLWVSAQPTVPDRFDTTITVSKLSGVTEQRTATIEIMVRNERAAPRTYVGGSSFPFVGTSTPTGLVVLDHSTTDGEGSDDCWSVDPAGWHMNATATELTGGEAVRPQFGVWDDGAISGCFEPGQYRFSDTMAVQNADGTTTSIEWGFTIGVARGTTKESDRNPEQA